MRPARRNFLAIVLFFIVLASIPQASRAQEQGLIFSQMSMDSKKEFRYKLVRDLVKEFREDETFDKIHQYMISKATELNKAHPRHLPDFLIEDTFSKTDNLFERTRFAIKDNPGRFYEPESFEKSVQRLLWLKGICFLLMGIKEEHQMAFSYFYLPGNENIRHKFIDDMVKYSFPEVPEIPENEAWRQQMNGAMSRLGYNIFSVRKFGIENSQVNCEDFIYNQRF
ncbi:MAG: hypothetical protein ACM3YE_07995 [Bacteroidota bacterium]